MAPSTRGRGSSRAPPPSGPKQSRGGIQKGRGRPLRVDRDGDLNMDASAGSTQPRRSGRHAAAADTGAAAGRGQRSGGPSRGASKIHQAISRHLNGEGADLVAKKKPQSSSLVWLEVKGLKESKAASNSDGGLRDLLSFLERKATTLTTRSKPVMVKKHNVRGDIVQVAATKEDAEEILKLNTFTFASAKLEITDADGSLAKAKVASAEAQDLKSKLTNVLSLRYLTDTKLLKLDALSQDPVLVSMGILESKDRVEKMFKVMMKICDDLFKTAKDKVENIQSVSLANNGIADVAQVEDLVDTFPELLHLDFSGNQVANLSGLAAWKGKFRKLETLYLTGNPIPVTDLKTRAMILQYFPNLKDLNGEQLTPEHLEELRAVFRPTPIPQHGPDFRDANGVGETFLLDFFAGYDADRHGLLAKYYDDDSKFSLAVDGNSVINKDAPKPMSWGSYLSKSRNITKITTFNARSNRLFCGRESIFKLWGELPATKHPNIKEDVTKYIMDCHLLSGLRDPAGQSNASHDGMIISVHGQFEEHDPSSGQQGVRSFSRTFVLGPGKFSESPIRVISDMLLLRAFSTLPNVFAASVAPPPPADEQALRQAKIVELSKQTNMTATYSQLCLEEVQWDFDLALAKFHEKKAILPADAFASA